MTKPIPLDIPTPLVDGATARVLLTEAVPLWTEFLGQLEDNGGIIEFTSAFNDAFERLKLDGYARLYEDETWLGKLMAIATLGKEGAAQFDAELRGATDRERGSKLLALGAELEGYAEAFDLHPSEEKKAEMEAAAAALSPEQRDGAIQSAQWMFMAFLAALHEQLSIMVHGEKLSALVKRAKAGDDAAFLKAIQIDKSILTGIEYFRSRFRRAHMMRDAAFVTAVARKQEGPPYLGRLANKKLWLALSLLDGMRLLDTYSGKELLDLLVDVGVIEIGSPSDDVKNLRKVVARFREFQTSGGLSTP